MRLRTIRKAVQKGFTLIELIVVVGIIGVLLAIIVPSMTGSKSGAVAIQLLKVANDTGNNWYMINQACGTTTSTAGTHPILNSASNTVAEIVFGGGTATNLKANYEKCYNQSKVRPLSDSVAFDGTNWQAAGYTTTITGGGTADLEVTFANVPDEVLLLMLQKYNSSAQIDTTGTGTVVVGPVSYTAGNTGARSVIVKRKVS